MDQKSLKQLLPVGYSLVPTKVKACTFIIGKRDAQTALSKYKQLFPNYLQTKGLGHLKLINTNQKQEQTMQMFFCLVEDEEQMMQQYDPQFTHERVYVDVPSIPPVDKSQLEVWDQLWSLTNTINLTYPAKIDHDQAVIRALMKQVMEKADQAKQMGFRANACLLYDPQSKEVVVEAMDQTDKGHPINHCVMMVMEKLGEKIQTYYQQEQGKRKALQQADEAMVMGQYFAKDLSLVIAQEPCPMCSMALVHSRVAAVYYSTPNDSLGGMNDTLQINDMNELNHRFPVYLV